MCDGSLDHHYNRGYLDINRLNGSSNSVSIKKVYSHLSFACLIVFDLINVIEAACCLSLFILPLLISSFISIWNLQIRCPRLILLLWAPQTTRTLSYFCM